ncbi:hypothetical protein CLOM_g10992 [Closterium sp. NIES-68]|nr:hypothetical protein CLOM_g10992 [Closterium sp. NIES-68]
MRAIMRGGSPRRRRRHALLAMRVAVALALLHAMAELPPRGATMVERSHARASRRRSAFFLFAAAQNISDADMMVLEQLKVEWGAFPGSATWQSGRPCARMAGVTCDARGHVLKLVLSRRQLTGSLPTALADLPSLQHLDLSSNRLYGAIPLDFANFPYLQRINLRSNQLSGFLPQDWPRSLTALLLENNYLLGDAYLSSCPATLSLRSNCLSFPPPPPPPLLSAAPPPPATPSAPSPRVRPSAGSPPPSHHAPA